MLARIESLADANGGVALHGSAVAMLSALLRFSSWAGVELDTTPLTAIDLVRTLASSNATVSPHPPQKLSELVFGLLVAEFECKTEAREDRLVEILAAYLVLSRESDSPDRGENIFFRCCDDIHELLGTLDDFVFGAARRLSAEQFGASLELVAEMLLDGYDADRLARLIRLGSVLLRGAPEGSQRYRLALNQTSINNVLQAH